MTTTPDSNRKTGKTTPAEIAATERTVQNPLPAAPAPEPAANQVDSWLAIETDGTVTVKSGKVELGTGVRTALAQIVAEELDVSLGRIRMRMGDTLLTPNEGYTAGSMTLQLGGAALRQAAATARLAMLEQASDQLDAALDELRVEDGLVIVAHHPDRTISYAQLQGGKPFRREIPENPPLKPPATYSVVGASALRVDLPAKFTGQPSYVQDVRLPGMLHGRVVFPPGPNVRLSRIDPKSIEGMPGIVSLVQRHNFVGFVAEREEQAMRAARQLRVEWEAGPPLPPQASLYDLLRDLPAETTLLADEGSVDQAFDGAARQLRAVYLQPYQAHASIGPSCAVADVQPGSATVWSSTQGPYPLRGALAGLLQMPLESVRVVHVEGPGGYGQNGSDDAAAEACLLSQAVGRPVRVQWSRAQEFAWEPKSAAMRMELRGALDAQGNVAGWTYDVWTPTHTDRPRRVEHLLAAQWASGQPAPPVSFNGGERNAVTRYVFANQRVTLRYVRQSPLRVSSFRALGGAGNTFANECFIDELAALAGADPLDFRLRHLADRRARDVLTAAAERAGWRWPSPPMPGPNGTMRGRGIAWAQYKNSGAYVASVAEVAVDTASGALRVERIVVAHDCGLIVNPDGIKNQIEGNVVQSLSRALKEEVTYDSTGITSLDWQTYPILTFSEVPDIDIVLINRPDQPPLGAGEPATVTTAPAVANAVFNATGARLRQVPFTPERVRGQKQ